MELLYIMKLTLIYLYKSMSYLLTYLCICREVKKEANEEGAGKVVEYKKRFSKVICQ